MNLLPKEEKEDLKKGLKSRFTIVMLFIVSSSFLVGFIMLLPSYFLTAVNYSDTKGGSSPSGMENDDSVKQIISIPTQIDSKLSFFQSNISSVSVIDSINKIVDQLPSGVTINSINFSRNQNYNGANGITILVSGTAADRDTLVSFANLLKNSNSFSSVDVPVSSLTKDKNLPFSINIFIQK